MTTKELINYLNNLINTALASYNQHQHEDTLIRDLCLVGLNLYNTKYFNKYDNLNQPDNIVRILCDKSLPIMVRINLAFGAYISWYQYFSGDVPRGEKRCLDGYEIPNNKRHHK